MIEFWFVDLNCLIENAQLGLVFGFLLGILGVTVDYASSELPFRGLYFVLETVSLSIGSIAADQALLARFEHSHLG